MANWEHAAARNPDDQALQARGGDVSSPQRSQSPELSMKKVAIVFVVAVFVPSMVLAWLAVRSLRDQQFLLERQASLLYQDLSGRLAIPTTEHCNPGAGTSRPRSVHNPLSFP